MSKEDDDDLYWKGVKSSNSVPGLAASSTDREDGWDNYDYGQDWSAKDKGGKGKYKGSKDSKGKGKDPAKGEGKGKKGKGKKGKDNAENNKGSTYH